MSRYVVAKTILGIVFGIKCLHIGLLGPSGYMPTLVAPFEPFQTSTTKGAKQRALWSIYHTGIVIGRGIYIYIYILPRFWGLFGPSGHPSYTEPTSSFYPSEPDTKEA